MNAPDTVKVTQDQNPAFFEELKKLKAGDKGKSECQWTVKDNSSAESIELLVEAWVPEGYEVDDGEEAPAGPVAGPDEANMTPTAMQVRVKRGAGGA